MNERTRRQQDDAGISESLGFLLIFTIVIVGIGLVTLYGYPMLLQQQTGADEQIMEKNMIVLQNDFKGLVFKTVPYKETSLKIGGGTLFVNSNDSATDHGPTIQIDDGSGNVIPAMPRGDLLYHSTSTASEISLQNGAVVKRELGRAANSGSVMLAQPRWFYDGPTRTMVINVVDVTSEEPISRAGIGTVQMKLGSTEYIRKDYGAGSMQTITVIYTPASADQDYSLAWKTYMEKSLGMNCPSLSPLTCNTVSALYPVRYLVVKRTQVVINSI